MLRKEDLTPSAWPPTTPPVGTADLVLDAKCDGEDDPTLNLSAAARSGDTMFLGGDEGVCVERLIRTDGRWARHSRLALDDILDLDTSGEADIEGLAEDVGWLWVLGSHARTRPKITKGDKDRIDLDAYSKLNDTRPRCLLARLPLGPDPLSPGAMLPVRRHGDRRAGMMKQTGRGNALAKRLTGHPLLKPFTRTAAK